MKTKKLLLIIITCLIVVTAIATVVHMTTRTETKSETLVVVDHGKNKEISLKELTTESVNGTVVNGKGEEKKISGEGILLEKVLTEVGITKIDSVTVIADDEYSAVVNEKEIENEQQVYLMIENKKANLVVFGDTNSKRNVTNVVKLMVE